MIPLWVGAVLVGALAQTGRNATQAGLTAALGTIGATQVRFLFGLPFALVFLGLAALTTHQSPPLPGPVSLAWATGGALAQIAGTALMLAVMKSENFGVTTAWLKIEPVLVALVGWALLGDSLTPAAMAAIAVAVAGVLILSLKPGLGRQMFRNTTPAAMGLLSGLAYGLAAIGFRGAIVNLPSGNFLIRASTILALSLAIQTATLILWMAARNRAALLGPFKVWKSSLGAGFLGAFASQFWFIGFSLTTAANVRTLALVEVIFAAAVSRLWFKQTITPRQMLGMAVILAGVSLLLRSA